MNTEIDPNFMPDFGIATKDLETDAFIFYELPISNLTKMEEDLFSTNTVYGYEGQECMLSIDFGVDQVQELINQCENENQREWIIGTFNEAEQLPATLHFDESKFRALVNCKRGELIDNGKDVFIPFVAQLKEE
jgi:hypothetical protein